MPLFHFHWRANGGICGDPEGTPFRDQAAARAHAIAVAKELMRNCDHSAQLWSLRVEDENGETAFDLFFADLDEKLSSQGEELQLLASEVCRRHGALIDARQAVCATLVESRMLLARSRRKPQLVYARRGTN